jgi:hypothetical protein
LASAKAFSNELTLELLLQELVVERRLDPAACLKCDVIAEASFPNLTFSVDRFK